MKISILLSAVLFSLVATAAEPPIVSHLERLVVIDSTGAIVIDNPHFFGSMGIPGTIVASGGHRLSRGDLTLITVSRLEATYFAPGDNFFVWQDDPACTSIPAIREIGFNPAGTDGLADLLPAFLTHFDGNFYDIAQSSSTLGGSFFTLASPADCRFFAQTPDLVVRTLTLVEPSPAFVSPFSVNIEVDDVLAPL